MPDKAWEIIRFGDYHFSSNPKLENDSHNTISIGLCKNDGTIHLSFDQHAGVLHYRVSAKNILDHPSSINWEASIFSKVRNSLTEGLTINQITYPAFVSTPTGNLLLFFRNRGSGDGDYLICHYNGVTGIWSVPQVFISGYGTYQDPIKGNSNARNAYINTIRYDRKGKLILTWTWRESNGPGNRDINYAYSKDNGVTWLNINNEEVASIKSGQVITTSSPGILIADLNRGWGIMNSQAETVDNNLIAHTVMSHRKKEGVAGYAGMADGAYFHYYQKGSTWHEDQMPFMGNRPQLVSNKQNDLYLVYVRKGYFDTSFQCGPLVVVKATAQTQWKDWHEVFVSTEQYFNEPQLDLPRWQKDNVMSVMVQDGPKEGASLSKLKVIDLYFK